MKQKSFDKKLNDLLDSISLPSEKEIEMETRIKKRELSGWKEKNELRYKDPEYRKRVGEKISQTYRSGNAKEKQNKFKAHTSESKEKIRNANLGKQRKGEDWVKKMAEKKKGNKAHSKPFMTPSGAFSSKKEAVDWATAQGVRNAGGKFDGWLKIKSPDFYYITKEEFEKIKNNPKKTNLPWMINSTRIKKFRKTDE